MAALFSEYAKRSELYSLDLELKNETPSTAVVRNAFQAAGLMDKKVNLFLSRSDVNYWMSVRNLANVQILSFDDVNAYDLSLGKSVVVLKKDNEKFKDMVKKWN